VSDPADLVTLAAVQTAYPDLDSFQIADLPALITSASVEIAERHPFVAPAQARVEVYDPGYDQDYRLEYQPVNFLTRLRADLSRVVYLTYLGPARTAIVTVTDTGTGAARVCTSVSLTLTTAGITASPVVFPFSTYITLSQLCAGISAVSGWTATYAQNQGDMPCTDLKTNQGPFAACSVGGGLNTGPQAWLTGYVRDINTYLLKPEGELHLYEWRLPSYSFPNQMWGCDPMAGTVQVSYNAGFAVTRADVARAAIIIIGDLMESTEYAGPVIKGQSDDARWEIGPDKYHFPATAERILSRMRRRRIA
jgi:hypothetical protein